MAAESERILRAAYEAFNARDLDAAISLMHEEVDWPNASEGGRVRGRDAVREYWERQFAAVSSRVDPEQFAEDGEGRVIVDVQQVTRDARSGELLGHARVRHAYRFECGLIARMDVLEPEAG